MDEDKQNENELAADSVCEERCREVRNNTIAGTFIVLLLLAYICMMLYPTTRYYFYPTRLEPDAIKVVDVKINDCVYKMVRLDFRIEMPNSQYKYKCVPLKAIHHWENKDRDYHPRIVSFINDDVELYSTPQYRQEDRYMTESASYNPIFEAGRYNFIHIYVGPPEYQEARRPAGYTAAAAPDYDERWYEKFSAEDLELWIWQ